MKRDCGLWINLLSHQLKKRMNAALADIGITGVQSRVLHYILESCEQGPVFQRDVEKAFNLSRSTATGILQLMEKNGMIRRESVGYDARLKSLVPTERAYDLEEQVQACIKKMEASLSEGISPGQLQVFLEVVSRMAENLES